jgi:hypothetical protein
LSTFLTLLPVLVAPASIIGSELSRYGAPALILPLVALFPHHFGAAFALPLFLTPLLAWSRFSYPTSSVALRFVPLKRCAGASVVRL